MNKKKKVIFFIMCIFLLNSCSILNDRQKIDDIKNPNNLYIEASVHYDKKNYLKSAEIFSLISNKYPYSQIAPLANLKAGESYYQARNFNKSIDIFNKFIKLYPLDLRIDQAYYMIGLCYYDQINLVGRDQKTTKNAEVYFNLLIKNCTHSNYINDARYKLNLISNHLADHEMNVGRFYLFKRIYPSAINRFLFVINNFKNTLYVPEALYRLIEIYLSLNLDEEVLTLLSVLNHNYPNEIWTTKASYLINNYQLNKSILFSKHLNNNENIQRKDG